MESTKVPVSVSPGWICDEGRRGRPVTPPRVAARCRAGWCTRTAGRMSRRWWPRRQAMEPGTLRTRRGRPTGPGRTRSPAPSDVPDRDISSPSRYGAMPVGASAVSTLWPDRRLAFTRHACTLNAPGVSVKLATQDRASTSSWLGHRLVARPPSAVTGPRRFSPSGVARPAGTPRCPRRPSSRRCGHRRRRGSGRSTRHPRGRR